MNGVQEITATRREAREKYKEYRAALAKQPIPYIRELKDAYNQLRRGHGIIDVFKAFKDAGVNADGEPRLAIWPADGEGPRASFKKGWNGGGQVRLPYRAWGRRSQDFLVFPGETFPAFATQRVTWDNGKSYRTEIIREQITAPLPIVPPHLLPKAELKNFCILWEVEKWNANPPHDPFLLRRISANLFAVVAKWDLTELERAVIAGRIR